MWTDKAANTSLSDEELKLAVSDHLLRDLLRERVSERRWKWLKRILFSSIGVTLFAVYLAMFADKLGYKLMPSAEYVAIIDVSGAIGLDQLASAETIVPVIEKAFKSEKVKAIALNIDSPGGQPFEAERIGLTIDRLKRDYNKPVYAFFGNTGASAAYLLALHADRIIAGKYSLVGSIGAVITGWDFHKLAEKFEVGQRVYASGVHKNMLNPWVGMSHESDVKAQEMVDRMAKLFAEEFKEKRKGKLQQQVDYTTGEVWGGEEALKLGLIDEIGTVESVVKVKWGLPTHEMGPFNSAKGLLGPLGSTMLGNMTSALLGSAFSE